MGQMSETLEVVNVMMKICLLGQDALVNVKYQRFEKPSLRVH
jgi:hypothetical protein